MNEKAQQYIEQQQLNKFLEPGPKRKHQHQRIYSNPQNRHIKYSHVSPYECYRNGIR